MVAIPEDFFQQHPDLSTALISVARDRLISTLVTLCSSNESFRDAVATELLVLEDIDGNAAATEGKVKKEDDDEGVVVKTEEGGNAGDTVKKEENGVIGKLERGDKSGHQEGEEEEGGEEEEDGEDEEEYTDSEEAEEEAKARLRRPPVNAPAVNDITEDMRPLPSNRIFPNGEPLREGSNKRKRPRYEICTHCETEFDVTENNEKACAWHEEEVTPLLDHTVLADHDPDIHGPYVQDWIIEEWPEAFEFECCGGNGLSKGCQSDQHEGRTTKALKLWSKYS